MASIVDMILKADVSSAAKSIDSFSKDASKSVKSVENAFSLLKVAAAAIVGVVTFNKIIDEASAAQEALNGMVVSLKLAGDFSDQSQRDFESLAGSIQDTSKFSDEAALSAIALAKSLGVSNDETKRLVPAAADLASVLGIDLSSATELLAKSLQGAGGAISRNIPQLRGLSEEAFKGGAALRFIEERFKGASTAAGQTFEGSLTRTKNAFSDLLETLGNYIVQNKAVIAGISIVGQLFKEFAIIVIKNGSVLRDFVNGSMLLAVEGFLLFQKVVYGAVLAAHALARALGDSQGVKQTTKDLDNLENSIASITVFREKLIDTQARSIAGLDKESKGFGNNSKAIEDNSKALEELRKDAEKVREEFEKNLKSGKFFADAVKSPGAGIAAKLEIEVRKINLTQVQQQLAGDIVGIFSAVLKGPSGAAQLVAGAAGAAAGAMFGPQFAGPVSEIVTELAKGPEHVRTMVQGFAQALPAVIENIIKAIPVITDELAKAAPKLITELIRLAPQFMTNLVSQMPQIAISFVQALIAEAPRMAQAIIDAVNPFNGGGSKISDAAGGGAGGTAARIGAGILTGGLSELFFADGGTVPGGAPYSDRISAKLTPGEEVIDRTLSNDLRSFLAGSQGSSQMVNVTVQVGESELANAIFQLNNRNFRIA